MFTTPRPSIWPATYAPRPCSGSAASSQTSRILHRETSPSMHQTSRSSAVGASHCCSAPRADSPSADSGRSSVPREPRDACSRSRRSAIACAKASATTGQHLRSGVHDQDRPGLRRHGHRSRPEPVSQFCPCEALRLIGRLGVDLSAGTPFDGAIRPSDPLGARSHAHSAPSDLPVPFPDDRLHERTDKTKDDADLDADVGTRIGCERLRNHLDAGGDVHTSDDLSPRASVFERRGLTAQSRFLTTRSAAQFGSSDADAGTAQR